MPRVSFAPCAATESREPQADRSPLTISERAASCGRSCGRSARISIAWTAWRCVPGTREAHNRPTTCGKEISSSAMAPIAAAAVRTCSLRTPEAAGFRMTCVSAPSAPEATIRSWLAGVSARLLIRATIRMLSSSPHRGRRPSSTSSSPVPLRRPSACRSSVVHPPPCMLTAVRTRNAKAGSLGSSDSMRTHIKATKLISGASAAFAAFASASTTSSFSRDA
mmetsp:Transcript_1873/g.5852  ORF Transcript_1873/g.5852 Transcript_1873/m.5852 type:complete len:222 (+) Transcript_1873:180-845(+)|eukprot:scaffold19689_cov31-Tisochrysis_lutea.AAC.6